MYSIVQKRRIDSKVEFYRWIENITKILLVVCYAVNTVHCYRHTRYRYTLT
jgi:hypothetical protein